MPAHVVLGLGYGDEGKGLVVDHLVRSTGARRVVRVGGHQAAHNVVLPNGTHHTFAQFGSGTFTPGVVTHLSRFMMVDPLALAAEAAHLRSVGVPDALSRLTVDSMALLTTPYHRAAGQATLDAVFPMARDHLSFPELGLEPHKTSTVLLVHYDKATDYVDITNTIEAKLDALRAHLSQFGNATQIEQAVREFASRAGEKAGVTYAEGFVRIDIRDDL